MYIRYFNQFIMEESGLKCINNNTCCFVCSNKNCKKISIMCADDSCQCHHIHKECISNIRWSKLIQKLQEKSKRLPVELTNYLKQVQGVYNTVMKQFQKSLAQMKEMCETIGLMEIQKNILIKIKQKKAMQLTGSDFNMLQNSLSMKSTGIQIKNISHQKKQIQKQTDKLIKMVEELLKLKPKQIIQKNLPIQIKTKGGITLASKITSELETILDFFAPEKVFFLFDKQPKKKIVCINLLYRASENNFQVSKFHDKCDGKPNTITLVKTQFGKIIGGFTPVMWNIHLYGNQIDQSKQSFIFSLSEKHKLTLINGKQANAISHYGTWGPCFSDNLEICDKANQNAESSVNPGNIYNNNNYTYNDQKSWTKMCGQTAGHKFLVQEWEVHQIIFE